jgi:hypothetical protein
MRAWFSLLVLGCAVAVAGVMFAQEEHEHTAPHGGTLIVLGNEVAHVELVLDAESGQLTAYVLDGEAEQAVRIARSVLPLMIEVGEAGEEASLVPLHAVENPLTGEKLDDTSEFRGQSDLLIGREFFSATLTDITVKGFNFQDVMFSFPQGNETVLPAVEDGDGEQADEYDDEDHGY